MDLEILPLEEAQDIDENRRLVRYKRARFRVNGREHTLRISMRDFDLGKTRELVEKEAAKMDITSPKAKK